MSCHGGSTGDLPPAYCSGCGQFGRHDTTAGCPITVEPEPIFWPYWTKKLRVMDDRIFVVDPGSPPRA